MRRGSALSRLAVVVACLLPACSSGGDGGTTPNNPSLSVSLSPSTATVLQGTSTAITATATVQGELTGVISFAVEDVPPGVSGSISNLQTSGNTTTATVTIVVAAATPLGTYRITLRATGGGISPATTPFTLTVTG